MQPYFCKELPFYAPLTPIWCPENHRNVFRIRAQHQVDKFTKTTSANGRETLSLSAEELDINLK